MPSDAWYLDPEVWHRHLLDDILAHWLDVAIDTEHGGYVTEFDRQWRPIGHGTKTLVSQTRLIFNFCVGFRYTGNSTFRDAAEHGMAFLQDVFADREHGGWFWQCQRDRTVDDDRKVTYGHAFAIFALAEFARTFGSTDAAGLARQTLAALDDHVRHPANGYWTQTNRQWAPEQQMPSQNPHMHLLEATLSLHAATGEDAVLDHATQLCRLARDVFVHPDFGCLEEYFQPDWTPMTRTTERPVEVGHQFEWAWLLHRMADRTGDAQHRALADQLMDWGITHGVDMERGGVADQCDRAGRVVTETRTFWPQSETMRALLYDAVIGQGTRTEALVACATFIWQYSIDRSHGGWFTSVSPEGTPVNASKGSPWKLDYHAVSLCDEAIRLLTLDAVG